MLSDHGGLEEESLRPRSRSDVVNPARWCVCSGCDGQQKRRYAVVGRSNGRSSGWKAMVKRSIAVLQGSAQSHERVCLPLLSPVELRIYMAACVRSYLPGIRDSQYRHIDRIPSHLPRHRRVYPGKVRARSKTATISHQQAPFLRPSLDMLIPP